MHRVGCRRLLALIGGLPPDSALRRDGKSWTQSDELAAIALERNDLWSHIHAQGLGGKPERLPGVMSIRHPDRPTPAGPGGSQPTSDPDAIRRFLGGLNPRRG